VPPPAMIAGVTRGRLLVAFAVLAFSAAVPLAVAMQSKTAVKVTEKEFKVIPVPTKAKPGVVVFSVRNAGGLTHDFVVLKTNLPPNKLPVKGSKAVEVGRVGKLGVFKPGVTKKLTLTLKPGKYVLICNVAGHYGFGMRAGFKVG
jgi:uncharacterized cupredoxin-like copper-binding protein